MPLSLFLLLCLMIIKSAHASTETNLTAGKTLTLQSGRDTSLTGALVTGDKVVVDVGRDFTLTSQQDQNHYDSKQTSTSASASFSYGSGSGGGGSLSLSQPICDQPEGTLSVIKTMSRNLKSIDW